MSMNILGLSWCSATIKPAGHSCPSHPFALAAYYFYSIVQASTRFLAASQLHALHSYDTALHCTALHYTTLHCGPPSHVHLATAALHCRPSPHVLAALRFLPPMLKVVLLQALQFPAVVANLHTHVLRKRWSSFALSGRPSQQQQQQQQQQSQQQQGSSSSSSKAPVPASPQLLGQLSKAAILMQAGWWLLLLLFSLQASPKQQLSWPMALKCLVCTTLQAYVDATVLPVSGRNWFWRPETWNQWIPMAHKG